jgi:hypothetical protein
MLSSAERGEARLKIKEGVLDGRGIGNLNMCNQVVNMYVCICLSINIYPVVLCGVLYEFKI